MNILNRTCETLKILPVLIIGFNITTAAQNLLTTSNLPIIIIDTQGISIPDSPKITALMKVVYNGEGELNSINDQPGHYNGYIGIELRGSSAQNFPKKSYTIETRDSLGLNFNFPLLGLPQENDWVLYAPYSDKSLLRNVLAYKLFSDMGRYSPRTKYCEVILNGNYQGVYILTEKIKRDDNRVDISRLRNRDTSGIQLTGGYILQIDRRDGSGWESQFPPFQDARQRVYYQLIYPDAKEIQPEQLDYIKSFVFDFENTVNQTYTANDLLSFIDINSLVDYMIISEHSKNVDAYRLSTYLYKDREDKDGRIKLGPVWDFNIAYGNVDYYRGQFVEGWHIDLNNPDDYQPPFWFQKFRNDKLVFNKLSSRWDELRQGILKDESIAAFLNEQKNILKEAADRNFTKWDILGIKVWPNPVINYSSNNEVSYLNDWIRDRSEWIDDNINQDFSRVSWSDEQFVYTNKPGFKLAKNYFYTNLLKIDRVEFISLSSELEISNLADSVNFFMNNVEGQFFIGVGYYQNELLEASQLFTILPPVTSVQDRKDLPKSFLLSQNYPNPFNPTSRIKYQIESVVRVNLTVYDIIGREVAVLVNKIQKPGFYEVEFDAGAYGGNNLPSGIYIYKLSGGTYVQAKKMLLLK